ncbi:MAG: hypothetical protein ACRC5A_00240 [Enterobacteriaceae bacterium]
MLIFAVIQCERYQGDASEALTRTVYLWAGAILLLISLIAFVWAKWVMKKKLFTSEKAEQDLPFLSRVQESYNATTK